MTRYVLIDCNNFFVSCERLFRPDLADKPVAVMSNNDGCIVARSNEVKAIGVAMGVPVFQIRDIVKQHDVTLFSVNFELYGDVSQRIISLLREEAPLIEVYSIDESFVDISEMPIDDVAAWAQRVRERVWREVGIPVSVGVAGTKTLAKVASTFAKTHGDGVWVVESGAQRDELLAQLPVEDIWGIGRALAPKFRDRGVSWAKQLVDASDAWLRQLLNEAGMKTVDELRGVVRIPFGDKKERRQTIMRSRSFGHTVRDYFQLESAVATFASRAAERLRAQDSVCRGVVVSLQTHDRESGRSPLVSRTVKLVEMSAHTGVLIAAALDALSVLYDVDSAYKKAAVTLVDIVDVASWQLSLLGDDVDREGGVMLMRSVDALNKKYGSGVVWYGTEARKTAGWQSKNLHKSQRYTTQLSELPRLYR